MTPGMEIAMYAVILVGEEVQFLRDLCEREGVAWEDHVAVKRFVLDQLGYGLARGS